ncbi:MAG: Hsp20/alpha crystallin family protein [Promethearchaeota archaeon]
MRDDFEDFINKIRKYFKLNSDMFDVDFLFIPESEINLGKRPNDERVKGFKISYHFESGMDKPEIKIEGNLEDKNIHEYLKNVDLSKDPKLQDLYNSQSKKEIDASKLSLETTQLKEGDFETHIIEPYTEICDNEGLSEILIEIPGMAKDNVKIEFEDRGRKLVFTAENGKRSFMKSIPLPFKSSLMECEMEVNNGIAVIKVREAVK